MVTVIGTTALSGNSVRVRAQRHERTLEPECQPARLLCESMASVSDFIWYKHEFPWLGPGFIHAVHSDAEPGFRLRLRELGVELFEMAGPDERSVFDQLADAYAFADYYGQGWDSFNDLMGDVSPPALSALLWRDADRFAARDPKRFGEACASIQRVFDSWSSEGRQAVLVLLGSGDAFRRPER